MLKFNLIRDKVLVHQPTRAQISKWLRASIVDRYANTILTISLVDAPSSQSLNKHYRGIDKATNVISLEYAASRTEFNLLSGELILCDSVIVTEAEAQGKEVLDHYVHMLVHGMLHLQGYDHQDDAETELMEQLEIKILARLGFANPYAITQQAKPI